MIFGDMTKAILSVHECKEIVRTAANIHVDETNIQWELNSVENSFGYIADLGRLTIWIGKVNFRFL